MNKGQVQNIVLTELNAMDRPIYNISEQDMYFSI